MQGTPGQFQTTHWSLVLAAGHESTPQSHAALVRLCETYWYPLFAYVRRQGYQPADAQDLIQEFFAELIDRNYVQTADPERGRFRSFLLTVLKRFLARQGERARAEKRGGGRRLLSLDFAAGEQRFQSEPSHDWTPEKIYQRKWALTLLETVLRRLESVYAAQRKQQIFHRLKVFLTGASEASPYAQIAGDLNMTEGAVKVAVHRLRQRYRDLLKAEVAHTLASPEEVQDELDLLLAALRGES